MVFYLGKHHPAGDYFCVRNMESNQTFIREFDPGSDYFCVWNKEGLLCTSFRFPGGAGEKTNR